MSLTHTKSVPLATGSGPHSPGAVDPLVTAATRLVEIITKVLGPTTVIAALMFYLGWVRTDRVFRHFGVDSSLVSFSVQDYIMRSVDTTVEPLRVLLSAALVAILLHACLSWLARRYACIGRWPMLLAVWIGITVAGLSEGAKQFELATSMEYALWWTVGVGLAAYGWTIAPGPRRRADRVNDALLAWVAAALFVVGLFWTVEAYAISRGDEIGNWLEQSRATSKPCVIVHSREALGIYTPGVLTAELVDTQSAYRYRYTGLRLLIRSGEKLFLLPATWADGEPITLVLADSDGVRVDLQPAHSKGACGSPDTTAGGSPERVTTPTTEPVSPPSPPVRQPALSPMN